MKRVIKISIILLLFTVVFSAVYSDSNSDIKLEKEEIEDNSEVLTKNLGNITEQEQASEKTNIISNVDRDSRIVYTNNLFGFSLQVPQSWRQIGNTETYSMWLTPEVDSRYSHVRNGAKFTVAVLKNPNNLSVREWIDKHGREEPLVIKESESANVNGYNLQKDVLADPQDISKSIRTDVYTTRDGFILAFSAYYPEGQHELYEPQLFEIAESLSFFDSISFNFLRPKIAYAAPIEIFAPWDAGDKWFAGDPYNPPVCNYQGGSYYGQGHHTGPNHYAVDFNGVFDENCNLLENDDGKPIIAINNAQVSIIGEDPKSSLGYYVLLDHGNGITSRYAHLKYNPTENPGIQIGQNIGRGEIIGFNGSTGISSGPHLHFVLYENGISIPPSPMDGFDLCEECNGTLVLSSNEPGGDDPLPVVPVSGTISEDTTWEDGYVYLVQGAVALAKGVTLTLEPGAIVKFSSQSSRMDIFGHLSAEGTPQKKVYFTSYKDDDAGGDSNGDGDATLPSVNDWRQIIIAVGAVADISNSVIRYGGNITCGSWQCTAPGALLVFGGVLQLSDSTVSDNRHGIYMLQNGYTNISRSTINNSVEDGMIMRGETINLSVSDSTFSNNGGNGIRTSYSSDVSFATVSIEDSTFTNNSGLGFTVAGNILNLTVTNTNFENNQSGDADINVCDYYYPDRILDFINYGNTTSGSGANGFRICGARISNNQVWNPGVPFVLGYGGFSVSAGKTLTINPGTIIKFNGDAGGYSSAYISVSGTLNANGTAQNKIYFTSYKDDDDIVGGDSNGDGGASLPAPEDYVGITINGTGIVNISNTTLRYGGRCQGQYSCYQRGIISGLQSGAFLDLRSSTLENNNNGIYFYNTSGTSTISVSNSLIDNNGSFGVRTASPNVILSVDKTTVSNNVAGINVHNNGAGFKSYNISITDSQFLNNQVDSNFSYYSAGGGEINFVNSGNNTGGTGGNGFRIGGSLKGNQVWNPGVPFVLGYGGLSIPLDSNLNINPGTIIKFNGDAGGYSSAYLSVGGTLNANGTPQNKIYFTSYKDDDDIVGGDSNGDGGATSPAPEDYAGINVAGGNANISNSVLRYGGKCQGQYTCQKRGVVSSLSPNSDLNINNSLICKNKYGIYRTDGNVSVTGSVIQNNTSFGVFHTGSGSSTNAVGNFWGHSSGPYHSTQNPNGQGNQVSNGVEFSPWISLPPFSAWPCFDFEVIGAGSNNL